MSRETFREFRLQNEAEGTRYAYLNEHGVFLGSTPLLEKNAEGFWQPRPWDVLEALLPKGYGANADFKQRMDGLIRVADAMNKGDFSMAKIALIFAHLPPLPYSGAAERLAKADLKIVKYSSDEQRVPVGNKGGGRWGSGENGEALVDDCENEWDHAKAFCIELDDKGLLGTLGQKGFGKNLDQCVRGMVSARCGGNAVG